MFKPVFVLKPGKVHCRCSRCGSSVLDEAHSREVHARACHLAKDKDAMLFPFLEGRDRAAYLYGSELGLHIGRGTPYIRESEDGPKSEIEWTFDVEAVLVRNSKEVRLISGTMEEFRELLIEIDQKKIACVNKEELREAVSQALPGIADIYSMEMLLHMHTTRGHRYRELLKKEEAAGYFREMEEGISLFEIGQDLLLRAVFPVEDKLIGILVSEDYLYMTKQVPLSRLLGEEGKYIRGTLSEEETELILSFGRRYPSFGILPFWENSWEEFLYQFPLLCTYYHKGMEMLVKCGCTSAAVYHQKFYLNKSISELASTKTLYNLPATILRKLDQRLFLRRNLETNAVLTYLELSREEPTLFALPRITEAMTRFYMDICRQRRMIKSDQKKQKDLTLYHGGVLRVSKAQVIKILTYMSEYPETDYWMYLDYLRFLTALDRPKVWAPENLREEHDRLYLEVVKIQESKNELAFRKSVEEYAELATLPEEGEDRYFVKVPADPADLRAEGKSMHHCVGGYISRVIDKRTRILFVRKKEDPTKPFVTLEVSMSDYLLQAKAYCNHHPSLEAQMFIRKWCENKNIGIWTDDLSESA